MAVRAQARRGGPERNAEPDEPAVAGPQRLFWWGFGLPFLLRAWDSLSWFTHVPLPLTGMYGYRPFFIFKEAIPLVVNPFQFFSIGFGFFANTDILFSIWFFFLIHVTQSAVFARLGFLLPGAKGDQFSATPAPTSFQGFGALCFLVFWGLWVARDHLRMVWRTVLGAPAEVDDSDELLSYRTAGRGALIGFVFLMLWLHASGMTFIEAGLFLFASLVIYVRMARIVAETGVLYTWGTLSPQTFVFTVVGSQTMSGQSAISILLSYGLINYLRGLFGPALAHVARLGTLTGSTKRRLIWVVLGGYRCGFGVYLLVHVGAVVSKRGIKHEWLSALFQWKPKRDIYEYTRQDPESLYDGVAPAGLRRSGGDRDGSADPFAHPADLVASAPDRVCDECDDQHTASGASALYLVVRKIRPARDGRRPTLSPCDASVRGSDRRLRGGGHPQLRHRRDLVPGAGTSRARLVGE